MLWPWNFPILTRQNEDTSLVRTTSFIPRGVQRIEMFHCKIYNNATILKVINAVHLEVKKKNS